MDLILMMDMTELIKYKVVEEVLNLVYDGKYSIDTSPLYLSSIYNTITSMDTFSPKSIYNRLENNINSMGEWKLKKQSSIQFHVWKQCIRQRETDEMIMMCGVCLIIIILSAIVDHNLSEQFKYQK